MVGRLQAREGGSRARDGRGERLGVHPARTADAHDLHLAAVALVDLPGVQDAGVLDRARHQAAPGPAAARQRAEDPEVDGLRPGGGERHLVGAGADQFGYLCPRALQ